MDPEGCAQTRREGVGHFCLESQDWCLWRAQVYVQTSGASNLGWRRTSVSPQWLPWLLWSFSEDTGTVSHQETGERSTGLGDMEGKATKATRGRVETSRS